MKKWTTKDEEFLKKNQHLSREELAKHFGVSVKAVKRKEQRSDLAPRKPTRTGQQVRRLNIDERVALEGEIERKNRAYLGSEEKLREAYRVIGGLEKQLSDAHYLSTQTVHPFEIKPYKGAGGEATMVAVASDWHIEEEVDPRMVNGRNEYNLEISKQRATHFFTVLLRLIEIEQQNTTVNHLILALLGDFITNDIHQDAVEGNLLGPNDAIKRAEEYIISGIDFLLKHSKLKLTIVCHSGNHARTTEKTRASHEASHSLEYLMYHFLARHYRDEKRITFVIPSGYLSYVKVYETMVAFHHGHQVRFAGGVGGITIPMNKAIAQWNRLTPADIYVAGHFHQFFDGNIFIANGSMIGYNAYALTIKAAFERPCQVVFGIHSKLGKYLVRQIYF